MFKKIMVKLNLKSKMITLKKCSGTMKITYYVPQCKALFTRDILTHNIAIKRYCDKKIFLGHGCQ